MDQREVVDIVLKYKELISSYFDVRQVILYGSFAKGNSRKDSDIDVAVIVNELKGDYFSTTPLLWKLRRKVDDRIEPVVFEEGTDDSGFLEEIRNYGIVI